MSVTYVGAELRQEVFRRAGGVCEYCLIATEDTFFGCQIDHIIGEKHGGPTTADNLAVACPFCNQAKGSDVGSVHWPSGDFVRPFNPRTDRWSDHFTLVGERIEPKTPVGEVTARILGFNSPDRILERQILIALNRYPNGEAQRRIRG